MYADMLRGSGLKKTHTHVREEPVHAPPAGCTCVATTRRDGVEMPAHCHLSPDISSIQFCHVAESADVCKKGANSSQSDLMYVDCAPPGFVDVLCKGEYDEVERDNFNALWKKSASKIIRRECSDCKESHKEIYYKRLHDDVWDAQSNMKTTWSSINNTFHTDFELFSTWDDAVAGTNAWSFCNFDDKNVGFPRDCGPNGKVNYQWNSWSRGGGRSDVCFSIDMGTLAGDLTQGGELDATRTFGGATCAEHWSTGSCESDQSYCNMVPPCDNDDAGIAGQSWCILKEGTGTAQSAGTNWDYCWPQASNPEGWECGTRGCQWDDHQKWDSATQTGDWSEQEGDGDCYECAKQCEADSTCTAFECGRDYCSFWHNNACSYEESWNSKGFYTCRRTS